MRASRLLCGALVATLLSLLPAPGLAGARFGIEGGIRRSKVDLESEFALYDPGYRTTGSAGLSIGVPVTPRLALVSGLRYVEHGERIAATIVYDDGTAALFERRLTWRYLALPVLARVRPFHARGPFLTAGMEASCLLTTWHRDRLRWGEVLAPVARLAPARPAGQIFEQVGTFDADPRHAYSSGDLALACGAGWEVPAGRHAVRIEGRYTQGLVDIAKSAALERRTRAFELLLGLDW